MSNNTKKIYVEVETNEDLKSRGLQRIKRKFQPKKGEMTIKDCQVISEVRIDADLYDFLKAESEKKGETSIDRTLNVFLREIIERIKIREELLNDSEFVSRLKEKLAA